MRYIILLLAIFFLILSKYSSNKYKKVFIFLSGIVLIIFASLRGYILNGIYAGNDYESYRNWFNSVENVKLSWNNDISFNLLMLLVKRVTGSFEIFIIITSIFFVYAIYSFSIKNSKSYIMTIFLFIAFGIYELGLSAIRQWIAGSIFLLAFKYIKDKQLLKYVLSIIIASSFHNSAIVLLIVYPFVNAKTKEKYKIIISIMIGIIFMIIIKNNSILELIYTYLPSYRYKYLNIGEELNSNYTVFIISTFCLFIMMLYKKLFDTKEKENRYQLNFLILLCLFAFTATLNPRFGRFLEYFMPAIPMIIPTIIDMFPEKQKLFALGVSTIFFSMIYIL